MKILLLVLFFSYNSFSTICELTKYRSGNLCSVNCPEIRGIKITGYINCDLSKVSDGPIDLPSDTVVYTTQGRNRSNYRADGTYDPQPKCNILKNTEYALSGSFNPRGLPDHEIKQAGYYGQQEVVQKQITDYSASERTEAINSTTLDKICGFKGSGDLVKCVIDETKFCWMDYMCESSTQVNSGKETYDVEAGVKGSAICAAEHNIHGGCNMHPLDCLSDTTYHEMYYEYFAREAASGNQMPGNKAKLDKKVISVPR